VTGRPLVSICIPAYNAGRWIRSAIDSALAQTCPDFELIVADNVSTDDTVDVVRGYADARVRIETATHRISAVANHNRAIRLSRGLLVKLLHADDMLTPPCLEEMVELALEDDRIGLVFAPREVLVEQAPDPEWLDDFGRPHEGFGPLARVNDGSDLFHRLLAANFDVNWVGEPSAVLVRRRALEQVGLLNERLFQIADLELWARIMVGHRVGFVDRVLSVYRHHGASGTVENARLGRDWFDRPWLVEGLLRIKELSADERAELLGLRRQVLRRALRTQAGRIVRGRPSREFPSYLAYRLRARFGRAPSLAPPLTALAETNRSLRAANEDLILDRP
jgi:glycosyltransferase involved in cell wall biosynthesis